MASTDSTVFAVKNQAYRVYGWVKDSTTGNGIAVGTLSGSISKDGGTAASSTSTPTGVTGMTGRFYLDLSATEMNANNIGVVVSSNTTNAINATIDILTMDMSEKTGHWREQTVKKFEDAVSAVTQYIQNKVKQNNNSGLITVRNYGDTADLWTQTVDDASNHEVKGEAT